MRQESVGWCLVLLVVAQVALPALALPEGRKFAVKPNAIKKVIAEKNEITPVESGFNWTSVLTTLFNLLFGTSSSIDKIDNGPHNQLVQLLSSLLEALKVSFSQRSNHARSLGSKDAFSDSAVAAVTIVKGYVNTHNTEDEICKQRIMCQANRECSRDAPDSGYLFCQLGTFAAGYFLEKTTYTPLDRYAEAGRQGRTGEDCAKIFSKCNEV